MSMTYWVSFTATVLAGAALILTLPSLFEPHETRHELTSLLLGIVVLASGGLVLWLRKSGRVPGRPRTGD